MRIFAILAVLAAGTLLAGCQVIAQLPLVAPINPDPSMPRMIAANITRDGARLNGAAVKVTCDVSIRLPLDRTTPVITIDAAQASEGTSWACTLPDTFRVRANEMLTVQWVVRSATDETRIADSGLVEHMPDCANYPEAMRNMQEHVTGMFPGEVTAAWIMAHGYAPTHGFTSYEGMGVAFGRLVPNQPLSDDPAIGREQIRGAILGPFAPPDLSTPNLLLFRPSGTSVTDAGTADDRYTLVGWAYAEALRPNSAKPLAPTGAPAADDGRPIQRRPRLACVPRHAWFFHAAGYHRPDGTFLPSDSPDASLDDLAVAPPAPPGPPEPPEPPALPTFPPAASPPAASAPTLPGHAPFYHGNFWDIHFFVGSNGRAEAGIVDPEHRPLPGVREPTNSFYYPTRYDE